MDTSSDKHVYYQQRAKQLAISNDPSSPDYNEITGKILVRS